MKPIFVGDPVCSWCYGFGKELSALPARHPALPVEILVGGLRAGATDVLDENGRQFRLMHWARVEESSGLPFNRKALAHENFVYDTEPICRAVVTARRMVPELTSWRCSAHCSGRSMSTASTARCWPKPPLPSWKDRASQSTPPLSTRCGHTPPRFSPRLLPIHSYREQL
jgi:hypothetical protein